MTKMTNECPVTAAILLGHVEVPGRVHEKDNNLVVWHTISWKSSGFIKQRPEDKIMPGSYQSWASAGC